MSLNILPKVHGNQHMYQLSEWNLLTLPWNLFQCNSMWPIHLAMGRVVSEKLWGTFTTNPKNKYFVFVIRSISHLSWPWEFLDAGGSGDLSKKGFCYSLLMTPQYSSFLFHSICLSAYQHFRHNVLGLNRILTKIN